MYIIGCLNIHLQGPSCEEVGNHTSHYGIASSKQGVQTVKYWSASVHGVWPKIHIRTPQQNAISSLQLVHIWMFPYTQINDLSTKRYSRHTWYEECTHTIRTWKMPVIYVTKLPKRSHHISTAEPYLTERLFMGAFKVKIKQLLFQWPPENINT